LRVLKRDWHNLTRADEFRIYPISDTHIGAAACDEDKLKALVARIATDDRAYWLGGGDYCEFINRSDSKRFDPVSLAKWLTVADLADLARAQIEMFLSIIKPISSKCLCLVEGNHEESIRKHYERDIYSDIVTGVKTTGAFPADYQLALGYSGYLNLDFFRDSGNHHAKRIIISLHHGYVGGRLAGAKALNMQRWLWTHHCDLALFGHSHNTEVQMESVEFVDGGGNIRYQNRIGAFMGTFLKSGINDVDTYSSRAGYAPTPVSHLEIILRPHASDGRALQVAVIS
jgi:hypothetical protein